MKKLLTKDQVCELLAISSSTLDRIVADGSLAAIRVRGRIRFSEEELEAYLARSRVQAVAVVPTQSSRRGSSPAPRPPARRGRPPKAAAEQKYYPGMKVVSV